MKKLVAVICFALFFGTFANAQGLIKVVEAFKNNTNAMHQVIPQEMITMMASKAHEKVSKKCDSISSDDVKSYLSKVTGMDVYVLEDYPDKSATAIVTAMDNYKDGDGFATLLQVNDKEDHVRIIAHKKSENVFSEVDVLVRDKTNLVLVKILGDFSQDDLQKIMKEQEGKFGKK